MKKNDRNKYLKSLRRKRNSNSEGNIQQPFYQLQTPAVTSKNRDQILKNSQTGKNQCRSNLEQQDLKRKESRLRRNHGLRRSDRESQKKYYKLEYVSLKKDQAVSVKNKLTSLNPVIDKDGLLRYNGKLKYAEYLTDGTRYPINLRRKSPVTRLIVK